MAAASSTDGAKGLRHPGEGRGPDPAAEIAATDALDSGWSLSSGSPEARPGGRNDDGARRAAVAAEARAWLGTPYHHQASVKGVGCDCLGLLRGVWRAAVGPEPEAMVAYTPDWGQATGEETLLAVANRHLVPIALAEATRGDVLVFRMKPRAVAKHCGILVTPSRFVHSHGKAGTVEANLSDWWRRHVAGAFAFPEPRRVGNGAAVAHAETGAETRGQRQALPTLRGGR